MSPIKLLHSLRLYCRRCDRQTRFILTGRYYVSDHFDDTYVQMPEAPFFGAMVPVSCPQVVTVETVVMLYSLSGYGEGELIVPEHVRSK